MFSFDEYLTTHAPELLRFELLFACMVIATGCGIALHGACFPEQGALELPADAPIGVGKTPATTVFATLGAGRVPFGVMDLSSRYGDLCNFRMFTKVRETYQQ